ncbi:MAG: uroporphyrinogen-III synthase, partial [Planctomycetaceae bacterium]
MNVLITRPKEDTPRLVDALEERGHQVFSEPLLSIELEVDPVMDLSGVQALVFTSVNGTRAFARLSAERSLPVLTVGEATAAEAREHGFAAVESAGGDVGDLADLIIARLDARSGPLFHAAGSEVAGDLAGTLAAAGFAIRRGVLYKATAAKALTGEAQALLAHSGLDAAVFFSPRTAGTFARLVESAGLRSACMRMTAYCLSGRVAERARMLPWAAVHVADRPSQHALLAVLNATAGEASATVTRGETVPDDKPAGASDMTSDLSESPA